MYISIHQKLVELRGIYQLAQAFTYIILRRCTCRPTSRNDFLFTSTIAQCTHSQHWITSLFVFLQTKIGIFHFHYFIRRIRELNSHAHENVIEIGKSTYYTGIVGIWNDIHCTAFCLLEIIHAAVTYASVYVICIHVYGGTSFFLHVNMLNKGARAWHWKFLWWLPTYLVSMSILCGSNHNLILIRCAINEAINFFF